MKPNVLFVNPPNVPIDAIFDNFSADTVLAAKKSMPLGILYLSSYIKKHNELENVGLVDYVANFDRVIHCKNIDQFIVELATESTCFAPDIILFSLIFSVSHDFCMRTIELLSGIWPASTIVVGGTHATNYTQELLENEHIDYVVRGEGEKALSEFIQQLSTGRDINVKGVYCREKLSDGGPPELCDFIFDLDEIPFPDWDLIDMGIYTKTTYVSVKGPEKQDGGNARSAVFLATRGCPGRCTFCSQHTVHGRRIRFRSVDNVIEEIKSLHERFNVTTFAPNDDMFITNTKRDLEFLERIRKLNIPALELQFPNGLAINSLNPALMDALLDAGTRTVNLAIESGSEYVQRYVIKKNVNLKKARQVVDYFRQKQLYIRCFFILGFPRETKQQMLETIGLAKSLNADWCDFAIATPLIGSQMYDQFVEMGCIKQNEPVWSKAYVRGRSFDTKEISAVELTELAYRANLDCNFINNPNKKSGSYKRAIALFESLLSVYPFHIAAWYSMMECYQKLGNKQKAEDIKQKITELIRTNPLAADMYNKYGDLMANVNA